MRILIFLMAFLVTTSAEAKISVVTSTADLAALVRDVAGDLANVTAMAAPNQDVHYVDARPNLTLILNRADLLVVNGLELEIGWLPSLITNARNSKIQPGGTGYFDASTQIRPLQVHARVDRSMGDIHPGGNPHYMHDPRAAADVVLGLGSALAKVDPANAADYRLNAARTAERYREFASAERERFMALPSAARKVVSYHDSLVYLLDWLGLEQAATLEPRPGIPPNPGHVAEVLKIIRGQKVRVIIQEEYYPARTSETLAKMAPAILILLPGGTRENESYLDRAQKSSKAIYAELSQIEGAK